MRLEETGFPEQVIGILKKGAEKLNPPQAEAVKMGLLKGKNLVVSAPTASGKTLIAELAFLKNYLRNGKTVYLAPLKALASEKYDDFREKYSRLGMKIAIATGDMDRNDQWLGRYDLIIASNEKMDSLLRHDVEWAGKISLIIADEIHVLNDMSRGPTLEIVLTRMREMTSSQIIALSATISNADELAKWLDAGLVKSDYRPIKLRKAVAFPERDSFTVEYDEGAAVMPPGEAEVVLSEDAIRKGKQSLVFLSTRRNSEAAAERISLQSKKLLSVEEKKRLDRVAKEILSAISPPTKQCKKLSSLVSSGVAFHHAGLVAKQRKLVEDNFRAGLIKAITSTPTLALGINLPAWRVVVRDMKRFTGYGSDYLPALEVAQMCGRAGRPAYDKEGEAVLVAKSEKEKDDIKDMYINGELEPIYSKLSAEPVLRMHVLALIAAQAVKSRSGLESFFSKTFFALQYGDFWKLMEKVDRILKELHDYGFIDISKDPFILPDFVPAFSLAKDMQLKATMLGRRVSELYVDPRSANIIVKSMKHMSDIEYTMAICRCLEMYPMLRAKKNECDGLEEEIIRLGLNTPDAWDVEYEEFIDLFKTSILFRDWMNEYGESRLLDIYGVTPGELYNKVRNAEWLFYAARELCMVMEKKDIANRMNKLRLRAKHGIKEELLRLIKLKGVGRVRARLLYTNGIKSRADIKANPEKTEKLLGKKLASQIIEEASAEKKS